MPPRSDWIWSSHLACLSGSNGALWLYYFSLWFVFCIARQIPRPCPLSKFSRNLCEPWQKLKGAMKPKDYTFPPSWSCLHFFLVPLFLSPFLDPLSASSDWTANNYAKLFLVPQIIASQSGLLVCTVMCLCPTPNFKYAVTEVCQSSFFPLLHNKCIRRPASNAPSRHSVLCLTMSLSSLENDTNEVWAFTPDSVGDAFHRSLLPLTRHLHFIEEHMLLIDL